MELQIELFGKVTKVIDPHNFWMQIGMDKEFSVLKELENAINSHCNNTEFRILDSVSELEPDRLVLVRDQENSKCWRRGQIARIDYEMNSVDILYIDYGETELVAIGRLCRYYPKEFVQLAFQCIHCCLVGIDPIAKSWTTRGIRVFKDIVETNILLVVVIAPSEPTDMLYPVGLYVNDDSRSVTHMLLDEEIGIPSDGQSVPEFFSEVAEFLKLKQISAGCDMNQNAQDDEPSNSFQFSDNSTDSSTVISNEILKSPSGIPTFDIDQIEKTKSLSSNTLLTKLQKENLKSQLEEADKLSQQFEEEAEIAVMAGYGGRGDNFPTSDSFRSPDIVSNIIVDIMKFSGAEKPVQEIENTFPLTNCATMIRNPEFKTMNGTDSIARKETRELGVSPTFSNGEMAVANVKEEKLNFMQHFQRILREFEKNNHFNWKLQMTELVLSAGEINREELINAISTLLKKAVKRFEVDHDIHLEILGMLTIFENFRECLLIALGKLQELFIRVNNVGLPFHTQCSKILGYIYILCSTSWEIGPDVCEFLHASCEKWIVFNKKGVQLGQDRLQEVFLEAFEAFWEMTHELVEENNPTLVTNLEQEIKEKLLNDGVAKCVRQKLLDILLRFCTSRNRNPLKMTCDTASGNETVVTYRSIGCQTSEKASSSREKKARSRSRRTDAECKKELKSISKEKSVEWPALTSKTPQTIIPASFHSPVDKKKNPDGNKSHSPKSWSSLLKNSKDDEEGKKQNSKKADSPAHQNTYDVWSSVFQKHNSDIKSVDGSAGDTENPSPDIEYELPDWGTKRIDTPVEEVKSRVPIARIKQSHKQTESRNRTPGDIKQTDRPIFYKTSPSDYKKLSSSKNLQSLAVDWITRTDVSNISNSDSEANNLACVDSDGHKATDSHDNVHGKGLPYSYSKSGGVETKQQVSEAYDWFDMPNDKPKPLPSQKTLNDYIIDKIPNLNDETNSEPVGSAQPAVVMKTTASFFEGETSSDDGNWTTDSEDLVPRVSSQKSTDVSFEKSESSSTSNSETPKVTRPKWIPGKRKCTVCGDENHLIYDCPKQSKQSALF